ncbi:MAG: hypothetical protein CFE34_18885 [Rhodobacteraceae bacterium PARR1]|nr:MAG: hypothetical protein CFE34_18885 [Rhodobacteraceae bacterium PARR1]
MAATLTLTTALAACASPVPQATGPVMAAPLRVTNNGVPFSMDQGARAKRVAMDTCAAAGRVLRPSIYDRFDGGEWVFVEGCA